MRNWEAGDWAWAAILAYELFCPRGQMLSEALDRRLVWSPRFTEALIVYAALHCANRLPHHLDLFHQSARLLGRIERQMERP